LVLTGVSSVEKASAQNKAAADNKTAALDSEKNAQTDIGFQEAQQVAQAGQSIYETDRSARSTAALARVSAGEAGVTGISVEALLGDIDRKQGEYNATADRNLGQILDQLNREKVSGRTVAQQRIQNVQPASPFATGIAIAGAGLGFWSGQIGRDASKPLPEG
jgi:hypothetical protein